MKVSWSALLGCFYYPLMSAGLFYTESEYRKYGTKYTESEQNYKLYRIGTGLQII
jgi:hypothetical protein